MAGAQQRAISGQIGHEATHRRPTEVARGPHGHGHVVARVVALLYARVDPQMKKHHKVGAPVQMS